MLYSVVQHTATQKAFILWDQHKTLYNTSKIRLHCITAPGTNLPNHLLWQTAAPSFLELKVTPCTLSHHQNTGYSAIFWFHDFYMRSLMADLDAQGTNMKIYDQNGILPFVLSRYCNFFCLLLMSNWCVQCLSASRSTTD